MFLEDRLTLRDEGLDTWVGRIWDIVSNRLMLRDEGLDTWIGRIWDLIEDRLTFRGEGLDTWIGRIWDTFEAQLQAARTMQNTILSTLTALDFNWIVDFFNNLRNTITTAVNSLQSQLQTRFNEIKSAVDELAAVDIADEVRSVVYSNEFMVFVWNFAIVRVNSSLKLIEEALE